MPNRFTVVRSCQESAMSQLPPSAPESPAADTNSLGRGLFRQEGDYWTVGYGARVFRLKDSLGLSFISYLLRHPGIEFHVLDLGSGAPERELARDQAKPSSGSLSMNRAISHGQAMRSMTGRSRVTHFMTHLPCWRSQ